MPIFRYHRKRIDRNFKVRIEAGLPLCDHSIMEKLNFVGFARPRISYPGYQCVDLFRRIHKINDFTVKNEESVCRSREKSVRYPAPHSSPRITSPRTIKILVQLAGVIVWTANALLAVQNGWITKVQGRIEKKRETEEKKEKYVYTPLTPGVISGAARVNIHHLVATT